MAAGASDDGEVLEAVVGGGGPDGGKPGGAARCWGWYSCCRGSLGTVACIDVAAESITETLEAAAAAGGGAWGGNGPSPRPGGGPGMVGRGRGVWLGAAGSSSDDGGSPAGRGCCARDAELWGAEVERRWLWEALCWNAL